MEEIEKEAVKWEAYASKPQLDESRISGKQCAPYWKMPVPLCLCQCLTG